MTVMMLNLVFVTFPDACKEQWIHFGETLLWLNYVIMKTVDWLGQIHTQKDYYLSQLCKLNQLCLNVYLLSSLQPRRNC